MAVYAISEGSHIRVVGSGPDAYTVQVQAGPSECVATVLAQFGPAAHPLATFRVPAAEDGEATARRQAERWLYGFVIRLEEDGFLWTVPTR